MKELRLYSIIIAFFLSFCCWGATVSQEWKITWVTRNPDNALDRPVMSINNQWPLPQLNVNVGDRLVVKVHNHLGNQTTGIHFHGLYQNGTNNMDGAAGVTQCSIPPGSFFTYDFIVDQPGTVSEALRSCKRGQD